MAIQIRNEKAHIVFNKIINYLEQLRSHLSIPNQLIPVYDQALRDLSRVAEQLGAATPEHGVLTGQPKFSPEVAKRVDEFANGDLYFRQSGVPTPGLALYVKACKDLLPHFAQEAARKNSLLDAAAIIAKCDEWLHEYWTKIGGGWGGASLGGEWYNKNMYQIWGDRHSKPLVSLSEEQCKEVARKALQEVVDGNAEGDCGSVLQRLCGVEKHASERGYLIGRTFPGLLLISFIGWPGKHIQEMNPSEKAAYSLFGNAICAFYFAICP